MRWRSGMWSKKTSSVASSNAPHAMPGGDLHHQQPGEVLGDQPHRGQRHDPEARDPEQALAAGAVREAAERRHRRDPRHEGDARQHRVLAVGELQRPEHEGREVGRRDVDHHLDPDQVEQQPAVGGIPEGRPEGAGEIRSESAGTALGLALAGEEARRDGAREQRRAEERGEEEQRTLRVRPDLERRAPGDQSRQHRHLRPARPHREEARADPARDDLGHPGVPGGSRRHAEAPVEGGREEEHRAREAPGQRGDHERSEARRLRARAQHHPASLRAEPAHGRGRHQLEGGAHQHRQGRHQARRDLAQPGRQGEGRDVGLARPHHHAEGDAVADDRAQVAAQHRRAIALRHTLADRVAGEPRPRQGRRPGALARAPEPAPPLRRRVR